jgi:hypothetical protein
VIEKNDSKINLFESREHGLDPPDTLARWFRSRVKCDNCGGKRVNVRPKWKEQPAMPTELTDLAIRKVDNVSPIVRRYLRQRGLGSAGWVVFERKPITAPTKMSAIDIAKRKIIATAAFSDSLPL